MPDNVIQQCLDAYQSDTKPAREIEKAAVKQLAQLLVAKAPGNSVEVRVPPYVAVQVVEGTRHRRGTPPATVECDARTFIELAAGAISWEQAKETGSLHASGERSDLSELFPLK